MRGLGCAVPRRHHIHVDEPDPVSVVMLHRIFVRHIPNIGVKGRGALYFDGSGVVGVRDPLGDVDVMHSPGPIQTAEAVVADEEPGVRGNAHIGVRRPGCRTSHMS